MAYIIKGKQQNDKWSAESVSEGQIKKIILIYNAHKFKSEQHFPQISLTGDADVFQGTIHTGIWVSASSFAAVWEMSQLYHKAFCVTVGEAGTLMCIGFPTSDPTLMG